MLGDRLLAELGERVARLEELRDEFDIQMMKIKEILDIAAKGGSHPPPPPTSHYLRVAEFLLSVGNQPRTTNSILKRTGISRSSLSQILHRTHKENFGAHPIPGFSRKKLWSLTDKAAAEAASQLQGLQTSLFGPEGDPGDLAGLKASDCCARLLRESGNKPMNALTMARAAIARGYRGKSKGSEDEVLLTTAKSFWASLSRDPRFEEVRPLVFVLRGQEQASEA